MAESGSDKAALALLALATVGWYVAARAAGDALAAGRGSAPGRRALGFWMPTALVVLLAVVQGRPEVALGLPFATSVASGTLVLGIVTIAARHTHPSHSRRTWLFLLPTALIALLVGFSGEVRSIHAMILGLQGLALALLWNDRTGPDPAAPSAPQVADRAAGGRVLQFVAASAAAAIAAWAGLAAATDLSNQLGLPGAGLVAALMLAPALVLPMIGSNSALAGQGRFDEAVSSQLAFVILNLCLLVPLAAVLWETRPTWHPSAGAQASSEQSAAQDAPSTLPATPIGPETLDTHADPSPGRKALPYPIAVWRVDTVLLVAVGMMLIPIALGRWAVGAAEGAALIVAYTLYMVLTALMAK